MTAKKQAHESWQAIEVKGGMGVDGGHAALCSCGVQSPFFESSVLAADWWVTHGSAGELGSGTRSGPAVLDAEEE